MARCFIGLGANLQDPLAQIRTAANALESIRECIAAGRSAIYRTAALGGPAGQPDYFNAVLTLESSLDPLVLLDELQSIENQAGRERTVRWGPRTLDLDLLLYDHVCLAHDRLTLPHPRIFERGFVLLPLADLLPDDWVFPDGSALRARIDACPHSPIERIDEGWQIPGELSVVSA